MVDAPDKGKPGIKYTMVSLSAVLTYFRVTQQKTQKLIITLETVDCSDILPFCALPVEDH